MSNTKNVKVGVCSISYDGRDLGYTKGGVEVSVTTDAYEVMVDQFGNTPINKSILARKVNVKMPLAETTIENMALIMPGSNIVPDALAAKATATVTFSANPTTGQTLIVNGTTVTFKTANPSALNNEVLIGTSTAITAANLVALLNSTADSNIGQGDYTLAGLVMTVKYFQFGTIGNTFTLAAGTSTATVSGATLTGGVDVTKKRIDVTTAIGIDLLSIAKPLRLHPIGVADTSQDFVIPLASTPGALTFAYKLDQERIFNVEFTGFPDVNGKLFSLGDTTF